jgi:hypothetical protein
MKIYHKSLNGTEPNTGVLGTLGTVDFSMSNETVVKLFIGAALLVILAKKIK